MALLPTGIDAVFYVEQKVMPDGTIGLYFRSCRYHE